MKKRGYLTLDDKIIGISIVIIAAAAVLFMLRFAPSTASEPPGEAITAPQSDLDKRVKLLEERVTTLEDWAQRQGAKFGRKR
jgi:hypothetical protein